MAQTVGCVQCGEPFEAQRPHAKLCSPACRKASSRGTTPVSRMAPAALPVPVEGGLSVRGRTWATLEAVGRGETYLAAIALAIAERMDNSTAVMGYAALAKELRATVAAALDGVQSVEDPVDQVKARRDRKLNAG